MLLTTQYKSYVVSNIAWAEALATALGKKEYLPEATVEALAEAHAEAYGEKYGLTIYYQQSVGGSWYFYSDEECTREQRNDTAPRQWQRNVGKYHKVSKKASSRIVKQVDVVQQLVEKFEALSKAQQAKFLRIVK